MVTLYKSFMVVLGWQRLKDPIYVDNTRVSGWMSNSMFFVLLLHNTRACLSFELMVVLSSNSLQGGEPTKVSFNFPVLVCGVWYAGTVGLEWANLGSNFTTHQ